MLELEFLHIRYLYKMEFHIHEEKGVIKKKMVIRLRFRFTKVDIKDSFEGSSKSSSLSCLKDYGKLS